MLARRAILAAPLALAACAGRPTAEVIARVSRDVIILSTGLQTAVDQLAANPALGFTPALRETCRTALAGIKATAAALATTATAQDAQPLVLQIVAYANTVIGTVSVIPGLPPQVSAALAAAQILLPVIQIAVGFAVPVAPAVEADKARAALVKL